MGLLFLIFDSDCCTYLAVTDGLVGVELLGTDVEWTGTGMTTLVEHGTKF
jgi:hypothetical protein